MVIIKLMGGMGNQLFQYSIARNISLRGKTSIKLDAGWFEDVHERLYSLNVFNIQESFAENGEIKKIKGVPYGIILNLLHKMGLFKQEKSFIVEPHFNFFPDILNLKKDAYIEGYWQTEKYFKDIEDIIRKEFTLKEEFSIENKDITMEIKKSNSISLHIRRGDYITNVSATKFHGICSLDYYEKAVEYIAGKIENPEFYIFSDDIDWVKENLKIDFPTVYVSDGILKDYEELMLMSYCKHNIIANSSFSWWGAWLNSNSEKIVIAPKQWFADKSVDTSDVVPEGWVRM